MGKRVINQFPGLITAGNGTALPNGAMRKAHGIVIRNGKIEHRRGHRRYSLSNVVGPPGPFIYSLFAYGGIVFVVGTSASVLHLFKDDGVGNFSTVSGSLTAISTQRYAAAEMNGNAYFTTGAGIKKLDSTSSAVIPAGVPRALDLALTSATGTSVFSATGQVAAYRVVYGIKDANTVLILGAPSGRATFTSTAAQDVTVRSDIPKDIWNASNASSYFYQVYRTKVSTTGADPGDECQLAYQAQLTATDVSNQFISVIDRAPDDALQDKLYTNPAQEKIAAANYPPPICTDVALFAGCGLYSNTTSKHRARMTMIGIPEEMPIQSITQAGALSTYNFVAPVDTTGLLTSMFLSVINATNPANNGTWPIVSSTATTVVVTNAAGVAQAGVAGTAITGKITIGSTAYFPVYTAEDSATQKFNVPSTGTVSVRLVSTALSLCRMVNRQHGTAYAYYDSGPSDGPGRIMLEEVAIGGSAFTITAASTTTTGYANAYPNRFVPTLNGAATLTSTNDRAANRLYISKYQQHEHVPLGSYIDIGAKTASITRITPLREACLIWKQDGLFRLTGTADNFIVTKFDETVVLTNSVAVTSMRNRAFAVCTRGIVEVSETSAKIISNPVANIARNFTVSVASSNELEGVVYFGRSSSTNEIGTLVYSVDTGTWTSATPYVTGDGPLEYAAPSVYSDGFIYRVDSSLFISKENRLDSFYGSYLPTQDVLDPGDGYDGTITARDSSVSQITVTFPFATPSYLAVGDVVRGNSGGTPPDGVAAYWTISNINAGVLTLTPVGSATFSFTNGRVNFFKPIVVDVEFHPFVGADVSIPEFTEAVTFSFDDTTERLVNTTPTEIPYPEISTASVSFRTEYSVSAYYPTAAADRIQPVGSRLLEAWPGTECADARMLWVRFQHSTPCERFSLGSLTYWWADEPDSDAHQ